MIDKKSDYLALPLPNEQNMLEDDCPRIRQAFQALDAHARTTDTALAESLEQANAADAAVAALGDRVTALESGKADAAEVSAKLETLAESAASGLAEAAGALEKQIVRAAEAPQDTAALWLNTDNSTLNYHDGESWKSIVGRYADA